MRDKERIMRGGLQAHLLLHGEPVASFHGLHSTCPRY